jgi:SAM-dependent methyltransferase
VWTDVPAQHRIDALSLSMKNRSMVWLVVPVLVAAAAAGWVGYQAYRARSVSRETDRLAAALELAPASRVADVGAGDGAYSIELASRIVPAGHVFATEIDGEAVASIREAAADAGLGNITVIRAAEESTNLPPGCCDAAFLRGVYHHIGRPAETNASLLDAVRPGGRLAVIDFEPSWFLSRFFPVRGVPANRGGHGVPPDVVVHEVQAAGFVLASRIDDWSGGQYCLVFRRP